MRLATIASHSRPHFRHSHQAFLLEVLNTFSGVMSPFLSGCHSAATSGLTTARLLRSVTTLLIQAGQPDPRPVRLAMTASHSYPHFRHSHQAFAFAPPCTLSAVKSPFRDGCHWIATSGYVRVKRFRSVTANPAQAGQPAPSLVRLTMTASHSYPHSRHSHQAFLLEVLNTFSGVIPPFLSGCHSAATSGCTTAKLLRSVTALPEQAGQPTP